jgi:hypothetical protein
MVVTLRMLRVFAYNGVSVGGATTTLTQGGGPNPFEFSK